MICNAFYYETKTEYRTDDDGNFHGTITEIPRCRVDKCIFTSSDDVWCGYKPVKLKIRNDVEDKQ